MFFTGSAAIRNKDFKLDCSIVSLNCHIFTSPSVSSQYHTGRCRRQVAMDTHHMHHFSQTPTLRFSSRDFILVPRFTTILHYIHYMELTAQVTSCCTGISVSFLHTADLSSPINISRNLVICHRKPTTNAPPVASVYVLPTV